MWGKKLSMISHLDKVTGEVYPVTLIKKLPVKLIQGKNKIFVTLFPSKSINKPQKVELGSSQVKVTKPLGFSVGELVVGDNVLISGTSKGKGFQGVIKRWGFSMQPASHGCSLTHRKAGSTGSISGGTRKGTKMPGRMGGGKVTVKSQVIEILDELIKVKGSIPGPRNSLLTLTSV